MPTLRLGAASLSTTPLDWSGNAQRITAAIEAARQQGVGLLCLPELCVSGYGCEDAFFSEEVRAESLRSLTGLADSTKGIAVAIGVPLVVDGLLRNGAALFAEGRLLGFGLKQFLANEGIHYEPRWFSPWPVGELASVSIDGQDFPAGDLVFDLAGLRVGFEVCRDAWVEDQRPACRLSDRGVRVLLNPSASHFVFGKQAVRERLVSEGSELIGGAYAYANLLGNESGRAVYDGGTLLADRGRLIASGDRFSYRDHTLTAIDIEVDASDATNHQGVITDSFSPYLLTADAEKQGVGKPPVLASSEATATLAFEEFSRAVPLGVFDYLRKSGAQGLVLSLSGGADSAATAVCVWLMVRHAISEIGLAELANRLPRVVGLGQAADEKQAMARLLTTVYQATRNSSDTTRNAAQTVADAVGAEHHVWSVDEIVDRYTDLASQAMARPLTWEHDDLALQNIQARVRSPGVWMLANLKHALLLTTGNRSEAAVGYATMDGDTSGGLAPLAGVDKAFLLDWLRWMEADGPEGIGPLPELSVINSQQPTAELRPQQEGQTDEADLMPYPVLAVIERSAIGALDSREATLAKLRESFPQFDEQQLTAWIDRFHHLWRISQWKRERLAPALHLDTLSVDPKTWRRWPILSGESN